SAVSVRPIKPPPPVMMIRIVPPPSASTAPRHALWGRDTPRPTNPPALARIWPPGLVFAPQRRARMTPLGRARHRPNLRASPGGRSAAHALLPAKAAGDTRGPGRCRGVVSPGRRGRMALVTDGRAVMMPKGVRPASAEVSLLVGRVATRLVALPCGAVE